MRRRPHLTIRFGVSLGVLLVASACLSVPPFADDSVDDDAGVDGASGDGGPVGPFRLAIGIAPSAMVTDTVTDVPIAIVLDEHPGYAAHGKGDGSDLLVVDGAGRLLSHQVEVREQASGDLVVWVRLISLPTSGDILYLHYGGERDVANVPSKVFERASAVWHFSGDSTMVRDSAGSNNGTPSGALTLGEGTFGFALESAQDESVVTDSSPPLYPMGSSYCVSMWVTSSQSAQAEVWRIGSTDLNDFGMSVEVSGARWQGIVYRVANGPHTLDLGQRAGAGPTHLAVRVIRSGSGTDVQLEAFVNGERTAMQPFLVEPTYEGMDPVSIGVNVAATIDEVRIRQRLVSENEIRIEAENGAGTLVDVAEQAESAPYPAFGN